MRISEWEHAGNVHVYLDPGVAPKPHHHVVADLAFQYGGDGSYLDIGCGMGDIPYLIRRKSESARISVADAYRVCLHATCKKVSGVAKSYLLSEQHFLENSRIEEKFDVITLSHVLEHLHNPVEALTAVMGLLNDTGHLIVAVPNPARPEVLLTNLLRFHYVNRGHVVAWDPSHWKNFLERIMKLRVVEYRSDVVAGRLLGRRIGGALARAIPWWGFSNIAVIAARAQ